MSTSSMDGADSEAAPLQLREGGATATLPATALLNAAPGPGRYVATLALHVGAGPGDELLLLERAASAAAALAAASSGERADKSGGRGGGSSGAACVTLASVEVDVDGGRVTVPAAPLLGALAAAVAGHGPGRALLVLDLQARLG